MTPDPAVTVYMQDLIDRLAPYAPLLALLGIVLGAVGVWGMTRRKDK